MKAGNRLVPLYSIAAFAGAFVGSIHCTIAGAQGAGVASYPTRPIRLIVPFPPGGSNDILGRMLAQRLTQRLGQQIVVDNRAGGNAIIGTDIVAKAVPNGYTLLITSTAFTTSAAIQKLPYDPRKSFTSISLLGSGPAVLAVTPALPVRSTKELIAMAKGKAGQLRFASSGTGGINHFSGELFKNMAGVDLVHVPYKGGGPAMIDVMAGHLEMMFGTLTQSSPHMRSGKLRAIAMTSKERWPTLPDIPTIAETLPGYESVAWWAIFAPAGLPAPIVTTLNSEIQAILVEPEVAKWFNIQGAEPRGDNPKALASHVAEELDKWSRVAKTNAIKVD